MKDLKSILKECSIKEIYCDNHGAPITYVIPIYQRNYAWERDEICALIKYVHDSMDMGKTVYYIGTLVTYKRDENKYEVIDGQQRLTTIYIILRALGVQDIYNRLTYSARKASASTIKALSGRKEKMTLARCLTSASRMASSPQKQDWMRLLVRLKLMWINSKSIS